MRLNEKDKQFLKNNKQALSSLFKRRLKDLKEDVFTLPPGKERDNRIEFVKEFEIWLETVELVSRRKKEGKPLKEDYT